ncbi:hypothetical protein C8J57DRAFT_1507634 [Mycena rebaudengoi]|nr:hypothetical protein C8J57DRAFT_1507634 [Mycena rebaudengoi]
MSTPWPILSYFFTLLCPPGDCTLCTITSLRSTNPKTPCAFFAYPLRISRRAPHVAHPLRINGFGGACLGYTSHKIPLLRPSARINGFWRCCPWLRARVQPRPSCTNRVSCATCPHHSDAARAEGWEGCVARVRPRAMGVRGVTKRGHGVGCEADRDDAAAARARCMPPRAPAPPSAVLLRRTGSAAA